MWESQIAMGNETLGAQNLFQKLGWESDDVLRVGLVLFHFVKIKKLKYIYMLMRSQQRERGSRYWGKSDYCTCLALMFNLRPT